MIRWVDLTSLPKKMWFGKECVDWMKSTGCKCKFKYDDIEGEVEIIGYSRETRKIAVKYLDYDLFEMQCGHFQECQFGKLLKKITKDFRVEVGQVLKDEKRDITIIDRQYRKTKSNKNQKWYKYHCNKCGNEDWMEEHHLIRNSGCNVCCYASQKVLQGYNDIYTTDYWMIEKCGVSEEDAKRYTHSSGQKITVKCPDCGREKEIEINNIHREKSIGCCCGDGTSYPEKFTISFLDQLNIDYTKEYVTEWSDSKRYDFYFELNDEKYIIEVHGRQHYKYTGLGRNLQEQQENDRLKKELALNNGIDYYIELDCRESNLEWIKNSMVNSELNKIFNFEKVDWTKCDFYATSNRLKEVCTYVKTLDKKMSSKELGEKFKVSGTTINRYLKRGKALGWLQN